ncbi:DUF3488 and transglutaminase-like domain-containing protein [Paenibacillus pasadenensis]|uniref:transglutaminase TgpA family protein n=1 Tax=Paenibacillus pasadenensis TaxID=217090 RepID=UPI00203FAD09|nr:transglutaminase domain-containing protein [Paenibacillus pasadenensis]MCM3746481.1 DUF3488 and transglutaminase-like domain-containing protein [Paenibacillus pasadenensis]
MLEVKPRQAGTRLQSSIAPPRLPRAGWFAILSSLLTAAMISSSVSVLEQLWWEETYIVVYTVIATSVVLDLLPIRRVLRWSLQLIAVVFVLIQFAPVDWSVLPRPADAGAMQTLLAGGRLLSPFLEIALAVWLIFALFAAWTNTRMRIVGFTAVNLLVLAVTDSFTPIYLWDSVAIVVFSGLVWLIAEHYAGFQQRHPHSWKRLLRYPLQLLLPVVLVLSLVMATGLVAPEIPPVIKDPYTAWQESQGEQVQSFVGDKGEPASTGKRSAKSGYSGDDNKLGGGFNFDHSPVMEVTSSQKSYWRGETKDYYTGSGWKSSEELEDIVTVPADGTDVGDIALNGTVQTVKIEQSFKMLRKDKFPVIFGAPDPRSIEIPDNGRTSYKEVEYDVGTDKMSLDIGDRAPYPAQYKIVSEQVVLNEAVQHVPAGNVNSAPLVNFGQLPENSQSRVAELAQQITADSEKDFDKALAIQNYLRSNFRYTNQPDLSRKKSKDFVDSFLFEIQEGYCDYFSTAMAVMARHIGLPSRWVKGYAPGSGSIPEEDVMRRGAEAMEQLGTTGTETYTVKNSDAHSWVEIYFEGYGWIPFEPTPGFTFPYATGESTAAPEPSAEPTPSAAPEPAQESVTEGQGFSMPAWAGWTGAAIIAAAAACTAFMRRRQLAGLWHSFRTRSLTAEQQVVWETERLIRSARKNGLPKEEHETFREAVVRWSGERRFLKQEFAELLGFFERTKYGGRPVTAEEAEAYSVKVRELRGRLKPPR